MHVPVKENKTDFTEYFSYHSHSIFETLSMLSTQVEGLSAAEVLKRREEYGFNKFTDEKPIRWYKRLFDQLRNPLAFVLVVAFSITVALQEYIDAGVIAFALFIAVTVGVLQEGRANNAFKKLSSSQKTVATVLRQGEKHEVQTEMLVPGDIVILQGGDLIPADIRLINAKKFFVNEATLTGEWAAVAKGVDPVQDGTVLAEQSSMAWMGTYASAGYATGVVVATGDKTQVGQLASSVKNVEEVDTPLQHEMKELSRLLLYIIGGLVLAVFLIGLLYDQTLHDMLLMSIAVAVASVPEGLPAAVTIILAIGMESLLKRGGLVRNLLAAETLGSTTYVLTDKTGTLTEARMSISGILVEEGEYVSVDNLSDYPLAKELFESALAASDAYTDTTEDETVIRGDSVERSILETATHLGIKEDENSWRSVRSDYLAFTSEQRMAAGLVPVESGSLLVVNGAPNKLLSHATKIMSREGEMTLKPSIKHDIKEAIDILTEQGKRLVAVGYKQVSYTSIPEEEESLIEGLTLAGVLVFDDPVRSGVADSIAGVQEAGARVVLVTGDNPQTALSIAQAVGIAGYGDVALTGSDLEDISDEELLVALRKVSVFARVLPNQKMRIASLLQRTGEVVAMTGDGINDAPALRRADIGIAIGSGTAVAKEASDLVLIEDSFATIYAAIEEGRRIVANLRKIVGYLLSTSLSEVVLIAAALITGGAVPILPAQILWANIIEEGLMSVAFAFEKGEKNAMRKRPQDIHAEGLISNEMWRFITFIIFVFSILNVTLYFYLRSLSLPIEDLRSLVFLAVAMDSLFISFAFRSLTTPVWRIPLYTNRFFIGSFVISLLLFVVVLTIPFFQLLLSYHPQPFNLLILPVITSFVTLLCIEVGKWLFFERCT